MKVSVVIPVYNVEKYLKACVNSVCEQSLREIEIILVDDGSKDNSGKICDELAAGDDRIQVIHKENAGVGAARNDGLSKACGEWVIFGDSDDWFEKDALEKLVAEGEKSQADVVFGDVFLVENGRKKPVSFYENEFTCSDEELKKKLIAADFSRAYCYDPPKGGIAFGYGGPWNKLVRRKLLTENKICFDTSVRGVFDDLIYTAYIFACAGKIVYRHIMVYNYRHVVTSITRTYKPDFPDINQSIFQSWQIFLRKFGYENQLEQPYYANVIRRFCLLLGLYFFNKNNKNSVRGQSRELRKLMKEEPYASAIKKAGKDGFHSKADKLICYAARTKSILAVYVAFLMVQGMRGNLSASGIKRNIKKILGNKGILTLKKLRGIWKHWKNKGRDSYRIYSGEWKVWKKFSDPHKHVFFGYYDIQQFDKKREKILLTKVPEKAETHKDQAELFWFDVKEEKEHLITHSSAWCWQQGARLRWHPLLENVVMFNDVDKKQYVTRLWDLEKEKEMAVIPRALYDVTPDMRYGFSLNYARLQRLRPGYGYDALEDSTLEKRAPADDGLFRVDLSSGEVSLMVSYQELAEKMPQSIGEWNYLNHISVSPDGRHLIFFHIWTPATTARWMVALYCIGVDGTGLRCLEQEYRASHYCWMDEERILVTAGGFAGKESRYLIYNIITGERTILEGEMFKKDGHPTILTGGYEMITDTYPLERNRQKIYCGNLTTGEHELLLSIYSDPRMFEDRRCDLHPRVTSDAKYISFDSTCENGRREVWILKR